MKELRLIPLLMLAPVITAMACTEIPEEPTVHNYRAILYSLPFSSAGFFGGANLKRNREQIVINLCFFQSKCFFLLLFSWKCCIIYSTLWVKSPNLKKGSIPT